MLRNRLNGSRGWLGPRVIFLAVGLATSALTWDIGTWQRVIVITLVTTLAARMDRWEWKEMLQYMALWRAVGSGQHIIVEEVRDADSQG